MMKLKIFLLTSSLFLFSESILSQNFGFSLGYASSNTFFGDILYQVNNLSFHLGYSHQTSDAKGKEVTEQKSNYGKTIVWQGNYFYSVDLGVGYFIMEKIRVHAELSICSKDYYINYSDKRFTDDGYHMIDNSESIIGFGGSASYPIKNWELFLGYNSFREVGFGFRLVF